ncbi:phage N-6-adenine-methyltransferase [Laspinema olomoucense]|jgi:hypothetical protein|uniref:Phage N-6-adenine-methyltransferase n=1 Tax=Laspinema olomoucense D3b TaxID=2953688 RepID=A0ABT2N4Y0_9CYAN|nr:phage N-6-adenine-methyltransferase [Laspinema sp. D3b]MCT7977642.1 phage N-6-adenine-methyltransferase [Laspinema sp. D3b]
MTEEIVWNKDCWQTPNTEKQPILSLVRDVFDGPICLDPCTMPNNPTKAKYYFTESDDFLSQTPSMIYDNCWMNPPFSKPAPFLEKMFDWYKTGHIVQAIALLKSGTMHNQSTSHIINQSRSICFWRSPRIAFLDNLGNPKKKADFDCILVYFGPDHWEFYKTFKSRGIIRSH